MPANCRFAVVSAPVWPVAELPEGVALVDGAPDVTRREPDPSSLLGLARVRFSSPGELTSIGGSCSGGLCCALAAEIPKERRGTRKVEAKQIVRRRCAAVAMEDMVWTSV